jgi:hypothetical protein
VLAGLLLRVVALPGPGTGDVTVWKVWGYNAARHGVGGMYGVGGTPPERRELEFAGATAVVDYPPLALAELGVAGNAFWLWSHRHFPNDTALNAFVKLPSLAGEIALTLLLFALARASLGVTTARAAAIAYWLNPAALIDVSVLGYLDAQFVLPAVGALVAAAYGWPVLAGALIAAAVLTKAQAIFIAPAVALAIWTMGGASGRAMRIASAAAGAVAAGAVIVAPVIVAGGWPNMVQALSRLAHHDMLSANALNLWWIVGYVLRVWYSMHDMGTWAAIIAPAKILGIQRVIDLGYPDPRSLGVALTASAMAWALWTGYKSAIQSAIQSAIRNPQSAMDVWLLSAVAAFSVHAYATLSAQVHENHLFAAVPLLVLASTGRRAFRPICGAVSAMVALNLNLFYGFGDGIGYALPRAWTVIDLTVILALLNCSLLLWHATVLTTECSTATGRRQSPAPA